MVSVAVCGLVAGALWAGAARPARAQDPKRDMKNPYEGNPIAIERGAERYSERCSFCHGTRGKGAKGPSLVSGRFKFGGRNVDLYVTISAGRPGTQMGAFASSLTGEEIWQIIAFLREEYEKRMAEPVDETSK